MGEDRIYRGGTAVSEGKLKVRPVLSMNTRSISFHGRDGLRAVPFFLAKIQDSQF
jgi:hypothetical protein